MAQSIQLTVPKEGTGNPGTELPTADRQVEYLQNRRQASSVTFRGGEAEIAVPGGESLRVTDPKTVEALRRIQARGFTVEAEDRGRGGIYVGIKDSKGSVQGEDRVAGLGFGPRESRVNDAVSGAIRQVESVNSDPRYRFGKNHNADDPSQALTPADLGRHRIGLEKGSVVIGGKAYAIGSQTDTITFEVNDDAGINIVVRDKPDAAGKVKFQLIRVEYGEIKSDKTTYGALPRG